MPCQIYNIKIYKNNKNGREEIKVLVKVLTWYIKWYNVIY